MLTDSGNDRNTSLTTHWTTLGLFWLGLKALANRPPETLSFAARNDTCNHWIERTDGRQKHWRDKTRWPSCSMAFYPSLLPARAFLQPRCQGCCFQMAWFGSWIKSRQGVWGDDLISQIFGVQAWRPQFSPNNLHNPGMVASAYHPRTGELEYKGPWVFWLLI